MPLTARLSASVPPLVKITSDGRASRAPASRSRDSSMIRRACRPEVCTEEGLPTAPVLEARIDAEIASMTSGSIGVVAA